MSDIISPGKLSKYYINFGNSVGDTVTNLKLQKLLYYTQAWHLGLNKKHLFEDDFEAWVHGPVLPEIYRVYRGFGYNPITVEEDEEQLEKNILEQKKSFGKNLTNFLQSIIDEYFILSAWELERMVHQEAPWILARKGLENYTPSNNKISKESMIEYYSKLAEGK